MLIIINNYFFLTKSLGSNGLSPYILTKSSLKITSFSNKKLANSINLVLCFFNNLIALWYCVSIILDISLSIT